MDIETDKITITCYGVRGSIAVPDETKKKYGCNTSCTKVELGNKIIILDAGTGLVKLDRNLVTADRNIIFLLSHYHYDHIEGLTYFRPFYSGSHIDICGFKQGEMGVKDHLNEYVKPPFSPRSINEFSPNVNFIDIDIETAGNDIFPSEPDVHIKTRKLVHPNGAVAYRIEYGGKTLIYSLDNEMGNTRPDELVPFFQNADLVIWDSHFTQKEYDTGMYVGWGHSTHEQGIELAKMANIKRLLFTHHAPWRTDEELDEIEADLLTQFDGIIMGQEERIVTI